MRSESYSKKYKLKQIRESATHGDFFLCRLALLVNAAFQLTLKFAICCMPQGCRPELYCKGAGRFQKPKCIA